MTHSEARKRQQARQAAEHPTPDLSDETLAEWVKDAAYWRACLPTKTDKLQADRVTALIAALRDARARLARVEQVMDILRESNPGEGDNFTAVNVIDAALDGAADAE